MRAGRQAGKRQTDSLIDAACPVDASKSMRRQLELDPPMYACTIQQRQVDINKESTSACVQRGGQDSTENKGIYDETMGGAPSNPIIYGPTR